MTQLIVNPKRKQVFDESSGKWEQLSKWGSGGYTKGRRWPIMGIICPNCNCAGNQKIWKYPNGKYGCQLCVNSHPILK